MLEKQVNGWNNQIICELNLTDFTKHMQREFQQQFGDKLYNVELIANIKDEINSYACKMLPDLSNDTIQIAGTADNCNRFFIDFNVKNSDINIVSEAIVK